MAEKGGSASSRSGTPLLWSSGAAASAPSGLTFNAADVPNLFTQFTASIQQPSAPDEVDHFMGQEPPPSAAATVGGSRDSSLLSSPAPVQRAQAKQSPQPVSASPSASLFEQSHGTSDFVVGFGSAPPSGGAFSAQMSHAPGATKQPSSVSASAVGGFVPLEPPRSLEHHPQTPYYGAASAAQPPTLATPTFPAHPTATPADANTPGLFPGLTSVFRSASPALPSGALSAAAAAPVFDQVQHPSLPPSASAQQPLPGLQQYPSSVPPAGLLRSNHSLPTLHSSATPASGMSPLPPQLGHLYRPVQHHWFYRKVHDGKVTWTPFSHIDSTALEKGFLHCQVAGVSQVVPTDGGRYDVDIVSRTRHAAYWANEEPAAVRRCSWFFKDEVDRRFLPYEEDFAARLEDEYRNAVTYNVWHKRLEFPGDETIVMHNPNVVVHFRPSSQPDEWGTAQGDQARPLVVKRGADELESIPHGEPAGVDHLVFVVQGIGPVCDLRFRTLTECVDDIRATSQKMIETHYRSQGERGRVCGRIEFLPVRWHEALRSTATASSGHCASAIDDGVNSKLSAITPDGVRKLRQFSNETLLDILFYTSPFYSQKIVDQVAGEINRMHEIFKRRNPHFQGEVSVAGHSLGALILFDILAHQGAASQSKVETKLEGHSSLPTSTSDTVCEAAAPRAAPEAMSKDTIENVLQKLGMSEFVPKFHQERIDVHSLALFDDDDWKELSLPLGPRKKLKAFVQEEKKLSSGATQTISASQQQSHRAPGDLVAPASTLIQPTTSHSPAVAQPSASSESGCTRTTVSYEPGGAGGGVGRPVCCYPALSFSPAGFFALGSPIAMFLTVRGLDGLDPGYRLPTCSRFFNIFHPYDPVAYRMEPLVVPAGAPIAKPVLVPHHKGRKRMHLELKESLSRMGSDLKQKFMQSLRSTWNTIHDFALAHRSGSGGASAQPPSTPTTHHSTQDDFDSELVEAMSNLSKDSDDVSSSSGSEADPSPVGLLNGGRRLDYVLQEGPLESFNEYLFSLASHVCYWESEDTALMIVREVYSTMNVYPDERVPNAAVPDASGHAVPQFGHQGQAAVPQQQLLQPAIGFVGSSGLLPQPPAGFSSPPPATYLSGLARSGASARGIPTAGTGYGGGLPAVSAEFGVASMSAVSQTEGLPPAGPPPLSGFVARR